MIRELTTQTATKTPPSQTDLALRTPHFGHGIKPTQVPHIPRQDANTLDPDISNPDILRDEEIPYPPPPYTPSIPMRASTLAPTTTGEISPTPYNTSANASAVRSIFIIIAIVLGLLVGFLIIRQVARRNKVNSGLKASSREGKRPNLPDTRSRVARALDRMSWRMEDGAFVRSSMASRADFDDIWSTAMKTKTPGDEDRTPIINSKDPESPIFLSSPTFLSDALPWSVPAKRESCPPPFRDIGMETNVGRDSTQPRSVRPEAGRTLSLMPQRGSALDTILEEDFDVFIGDVPPNATDSDEPVHKQSTETLSRNSFTESASSCSDSNSDAMSIVSVVDHTPKRASMIKGRGRQDSNASRTTNASESVAKDMASFSDGFQSNASSMTSVATMAYSTISDSSDGYSTEAGEILETRRVGSMEVKRAVLLDLALETPKASGDYAPQLPEVAVISPILESNFSFESKEAKMLQPVMVQGRSSSLKTLQSSASGGTIDLDDFPIPPRTLDKPSPITFTISSASGSIRSLHH